MWSVFLWVETHSSNTEALHTCWFMVLSLLWNKNSLQNLYTAG